MAWFAKFHFSKFCSFNSTLHFASLITFFIVTTYITQAIHLTILNLTFNSSVHNYISISKLDRSTILVVMSVHLWKSTKFYFLDPIVTFTCVRFCPPPISSCAAKQGRNTLLVVLRDRVSTAFPHLLIIQRIKYDHVCMHLVRVFFPPYNG